MIRRLQVAHNDPPPVPDVLFSFSILFPSVQLEHVWYTPGFFLLWNDATLAIHGPLSQLDLTLPFRPRLYHAMGRQAVRIARPA